MPDHTGNRLEGTTTMKDFRLNQMLMLTALMLTLAAMLAGPAAATSFDDKASLYKGDNATTPTVIPYLSHGLGTEQTTEPTQVIPDLSHGQGLGTEQSTEPKQVIPYMSHGLGLAGSQYGQDAQSQPQVIPYLSHGQGLGTEQSTEPSKVIPY